MAYKSPWISLSEARDHVAFSLGDADKAWPQLRDAIRDGALEARGFTGKIEEDLPPSWFAEGVPLDNEPSWEMDALFYTDDARFLVDPPAPYLCVERIKVNVETMRELWPGNKTCTQNNSTPPKNHITQKESETAYKKRVKGWLPNKIPPSREEDQKWGKDNGLSRTRIRQLRRNHAPDSWKKTGPKKK
ncbi:hypothetical protein [Magnetospira sp. QH-2]|uniref:hypothetical protein n=1 Tax=Magnetospira sp. (strain QH-2) TaxID=1288970 RepID=UPI0003E81616|nr:hypothetical protein [Magnetospira sp. QH-2]CCQ72416.1 protein of unknown function [Magnetospira sp. QH-2]